MTKESSPSRESAPKSLNKDPIHYSNLAVTYDLDSCIRWINNNNFEKVCLQFPESLLIDSVDITAYIENSICRKAYILGDTAYGSCCVDEVAARHVAADAVVHFGHACLSAVSIPVYYVLPRAPLDVTQLVTSLQQQSSSKPLLILYDVAFYHHIDELRKKLTAREELREGVCIADLVLPNQPYNGSKTCSAWCQAGVADRQCSSTRLQRNFCYPPADPFQTLLYIGETTPNLYNFLCIFKDVEVLQYTEAAGLQQVKQDSMNKRLSYLVERIRSAKAIGIVVATLGIKGCREAVEHAKHLCNSAGKKSYILSLGKPNPAKLANFSQVDVYVTINCPEADFGDRKNYLQPMCGLYELDLAINSSRSWDSCISSMDFRDIIKGGCEYIAADVPRREDEGEAVRPDTEVSQPLHVIPLASADLAPSTYRRWEWQGLDQRLGEFEAAQLTVGRSGAPQSAYSSEPKQ